MGLFKHLLFWPVTGPKALVKFSLRQVESVAHRELTDDDLVKEDLMALQMELELGDIDEAEYERCEAALMQRLRDARAWRTKLGMEDEWAPVTMAPPREADHGGSDSPPSDRAPKEGETWPTDSLDASPADSSSS